MLRIPCPYCGSTRDEDEFTFGGPYERVRPSGPHELDDSQWADYLFMRDNIRGASLERWRHTFGCRQWFGVERDTVTHKVIRVLTFAEVPRHYDDKKRVAGGVHEAA